MSTKIGQVLDINKQCVMRFGEGASFAGVKYLISDNLHCLHCDAKYDINGEHGNIMIKS